MLSEPEQVEDSKKKSGGPLKCALISFGIALGVVLFFNFAPNLMDVIFRAGEKLSVVWTRLYFDYLKDFPYLSHTYTLVWLTCVIYFCCRKKDWGILISLGTGLFVFVVLVLLYMSGFWSIIKSSKFKTRENSYLVFISTPPDFEKQAKINEPYLKYVDRTSAFWTYEEWLMGYFYRAQMIDNKRLTLNVDRAVCEQYALSMDIYKTFKKSNSSVNIIQSSWPEDAYARVFYTLSINGKEFTKLNQCKSGKNELTWMYRGV